MSWGTCYSGANNIHPEQPAMMSDGKTFTLYNPACDVNNRIQHKNGIKSNYEYRQFMIKNGISIMNKNSKVFCEQNAECLHKCGNPSTYSKYLFKGLYDDNQPYGYENSDLKNLYTGRQELNNSYISPIVTQDDLLKLSSRK